MKITIEDGDFIELQGMVQECTDVKFNISWLKEFILGRDYLIGEWYKCGTYETGFRECMASELSRHLIKKSWPSYGDTRNGVKFEDFEAEFKLAAEIEGNK